MFFNLFILMLLLALPGLYFYGRENSMCKTVLVGIAVLIATFFGTWFAIETDLVGPFLEKLMTGQFDLIDLLFIFLVAIFFGPACSMFQLAMYYGYLKWTLSSKAFATVDSCYLNQGIGGRSFFEGVTIEILFRWGLMSALYFLFLKLFGSHSVTLFLAVILSGVLYTFWQLRTVKSIPTEQRKSLAIYIVIVSLMTSLFTGYTFAGTSIVTALLVQLEVLFFWYPVQTFMRMQNNNLTKMD